MCIGLSRFVHKRSAGANAQIMSPTNRHARLKAYVLYREKCVFKLIQTILNAEYFEKKILRKRNKHI